MGKHNSSLVKEEMFKKREYLNDRRVYCSSAATIYVRLLGRQYFLENITH